MYGFSYLCFISRKNPNIILDFRNLTLTNPVLNLDYLEILKNQGITSNDFTSGLESSDLRVILEKAKNPLFYTFLSGKWANLITVSTRFLPKIRPVLQRLLDDFENLAEQDLHLDFNDKKNISDLQDQTHNTKSNFASESQNSPLQQNHFQKIKPKLIDLLAKNLASLIMLDFLIPERKWALNDPQVEEKLGDNNDLEIFKKLDNTWTISEHLQFIDVEKWELQEKLFHFWMADLIYFRFKFYPWDRFQQTVKASLFMEPGSKENKDLIQKFNTSKIIKLLELIGEGISYQKLLHSFNLTKTKLNIFLEELRRNQIIRKIPTFPNIGHISEDLIPLLTMQGFSKTDFKILHTLENIIDNDKSLDDISLEIALNPEHIKILLDRYQSSIRVLI